MPVEGLNSSWHYRLHNVKSGTVADLSGTDQQSVIGFSQGDGDNQLWRIDEHDDGWTFTNKWNGKVLGIGYAPANNGIAVQGQDHEFKWDIVHVEDNIYQIVVPNEVSEEGRKFVVDLSDRGNAANGTKITLWENYDSQNQRWRFEAV